MPIGRAAPGAWCGHAHAPSSHMTVANLRTGGRGRPPSGPTAPPRHATRSDEKSQATNYGKRRRGTMRSTEARRGPTRLRSSRE